MIAQRALAAHRQMVYPKDALISSETYDCSKSITITELNCGLCDHMHFCAELPINSINYIVKPQLFAN